MSEYLIIGAGIIGLLTARELAKQGASVTLLDANDFGQEASWAGGGIVSPLYPWRYPDEVTQLAQASQKIYPELAKELYSETGIDIELDNSGLLILDAADALPALAWGSAQNINVQYLDEEEVIAKQTGLGVNAKAVWMPQVMQVRNPRLLKALVASLKNTQVKLYPKQKIVKFNCVNNQVISAESQDKIFSANNIIIAAGVSSKALLKLLGEDFPIEPVKGQMLMFKASSLLLNTIVLYRNHYLIPRRDGFILAGSTLEPDAGYNKMPTKAAYDELYHAAINLLPALKNAQVVAQWSGLRPSSPQGVPFINKLMQFGNIYLNSGHFRNGLVLAPGSVGKLMAILPG